MTISSGLLMMQWLLIICCLFPVSSSFSFSLIRHKCNSTDLSALLHFKHGFQIACLDASNDPSAYPKTSSWNNKSQVGAHWDGIQCDPLTGHVIGLDLSSSCLNGLIDSTIFTKLVHLQYLNLADNFFSYSSIPLELGNLSRLSYLNLSDSGFSGTIPIEISKLSQLYLLDLSKNHLEGELPQGIFHLPHLQVMRVSWNKDLKAECLPDDFSSTSHLQVLSLSGVNFSGTRVPVSIGNLVSLQKLYLSDCNLSGPIPSSLANLTQLIHLHLGDNNLLFTPSSNSHHSSLSWLAKLTKLESLVLRSVNLTGELPHCFENFTTALRVLNLRNNSLHGRIPEMCSNNGVSRFLRMIDLSNNRFEGQLPRSLSKCFNLEFLNVGNNLLNDTFPSWLGSLPHLKVLALRLNGIHGSIAVPNNKWSRFPELRIIDLSYNNLSGELSSMLFQGLDAMKSINLNSSNYMNGLSSHGSIYYYSIGIADKGVELQYTKISESLFGIDLSHNRFEGTVPRILGDLRALHLLNLSYNRLTGPIPSSLAELKELQSLDLSSNTLSGNIPQQLSQITSISIFNVSYNNNLTGPIPQGRQFDTFDNSSYIGNPGLCGKPLLRNCGNSPTPDHVAEIDQKQDKFLDTTEWMVVLIGFAGGLIVGVALENTVDLRTPALSWIRKIRGQLSIRN